MTQRPAELLQATHLTRKFADAAAVQDVSLTLRPGQVLGLLGLNGAGKSSTLSMLAGVLAPDAGEIHIQGQSLLGDPVAAKRNIGYLPEVAPLYPDMSVRHYLHYAAKLRRVRAEVRQQRIDTLLEQLELTTVAQRRIGRLSKGFRQRVGIAQALIHDPALIILDEPSSGLDPAQMLDMRDLIRRLGQSHGVIFSSHMLSEVNEVCTHVAILHHGRIVHTGELSDDLPGAQSGFRVRFSAAVERSALLNLTTVDAVISQQGQYFHLTTSSGVSGEQLLADLVAQKFAVTEFGPHGASLETLFSTLVTTDGAAGMDAISA